MLLTDALSRDGIVRNGDPPLHERLNTIHRGRGQPRAVVLGPGLAMPTNLAALTANARLTRADGRTTAVETDRLDKAFISRERLQLLEKAAIGEAAAALVNDGESIALDASTTAIAVARALRSRRAWTQLTIVTNGLRVLAELADCPGVTVVLLGGWLRSGALSLVGTIDSTMFGRINVQTAFVGAAGFTTETGLSDATEDEAQMKRHMVAAARTVVSILDHTKFGHAALATFCSTDQISLVITDDRAPLEIIGELRERGIAVQAIHVSSHESGSIGMSPRARSGVRASSVGRPDEGDGGEAVLLTDHAHSSQIAQNEEDKK